MDSGRGLGSFPPALGSGFGNLTRRQAEDRADMGEATPDGLTLRTLQDRIHALYGSKDAARGDLATFLWLTEEFGELATALRSGTSEELAREMADVLAWLATLANLRGIDLGAAVWQKYGRGCPGCGGEPCGCDPAEKP